VIPVGAALEAVARPGASPPSPVGARDEGNEAVCSGLAVCLAEHQRTRSRERALGHFRRASRSSHLWCVVPCGQCGSRASLQCTRVVPEPERERHKNGLELVLRTMAAIGDALEFSAENRHSWCHRQIARLGAKHRDATGHCAVRRGFSQN
jgi:hypothetical protein